MKKFLVLLVFSSALIAVASVMGIFHALGGINVQWWVPVALFVVGLLVLSWAIVLGAEVMSREYETMPLKEREKLHRIGRKTAKEVLDACVEDREPNIGRVIARGISDEIEK